MHTKIGLIVLHFDFAKSDHKCLLKNNDLIYSDISLPIDSRLRELLSAHLDIDPEWVTFYLVDVVDNQDDVIIYYTCMIPSIIENKIGDWVGIGEIINEDIQKTIFLASQKIIA